MVTTTVSATAARSNVPVKVFGMIDNSLTPSIDVVFQFFRILCQDAHSFRLIQVFIFPQPKDEAIFSWQYGQPNIDKLV